MSATNAPFGFICAKHPSGQSRANEYQITSAYAVNIFQGDPVKLTTDGVIQLATSDGTRTGTVDGIEVLGIFGGCSYVDSTGKPNWSAYWPASTVATEIKAYVYDDKENIYEVQADGSVDAVDIGSQADWTGFTAPGGSTATGRSLATLSATPVAGGAQGQFAIVEIQRGVDNAFADAYTKVLVKVAEHIYAAPFVSV
jgi:hypothetical protein